MSQLCQASLLLHLGSLTYTGDSGLRQETPSQAVPVPGWGNEAACPVRVNVITSLLVCLQVPSSFWFHLPYLLHSPYTPQPYTPTLPPNQRKRASCLLCWSWEAWDVWQGSPSQIQSSHGWCGGWLKEERQEGGLMLMWRTHNMSGSSHTFFLKDKAERQIGIFILILMLKSGKLRVPPIKWLA